MAEQDETSVAQGHEPDSIGSLMGLGIVIAALGLLLSVYTMIHHLELKATGATDAFCNINSTFNCDDIARSKYSELFGIPLGIYGAGYFLSLAVLLITSRIKSQYRNDALHTYRFLVYSGVGVTLVLAGLSFFALGKGCLNCIGVYILCMAQAGAVIAFKDRLPNVDNAMKSLSNGLTFALIPMALAVGSFTLLKPSSPNFHADVPQTGAVPARPAPADQVIFGATQVIELNRSPFSGLGEDYREGPDDAKVVIVEFADFQCPACKHAYSMLKQLKLDFGDRIQVVFKNYPLDQKCNKAITHKMHEFACDAAMLSRCVGKKGNYFAIHHLLLDRQEQLSTENAKAWAKEMGLSDAEVQECLVSADVMAKIRDDIAQGDKVGVEGTPTLFLNGRKIQGASNDDGVRRAIEHALNE